MKIGFVSTFSGPTAVIGNDMRNSFELALDHLGRKMGGQPVEVIYEDDQQKPEVGVQKTAEADRVRQGRFRRRLYLVERAAGLAQAGGRFADLPDQRQCRPLADRRRAVLALLFSTSWQNDQTPQAMGDYMNEKGVKTRVPDRPQLRRRQGHAHRRARRPSRARSSARS